MFAACGAMSGPDSPLRPVATIGETAAQLALSQEGQGYMGQDGKGYETSILGHANEPEYWCADFVKWAWRNAGADVGGLNAGAGSFGLYGWKHGTFHDGDDPGYQPKIGDAVIFDFNYVDWAAHVAIVTKVNDDGTIETTSGDWGGVEGQGEAVFASTAHVVVNRPAFAPIPGTRAPALNQTISAFISPVPNAQAQEAALHLASGPNYGVHIGEAQLVAAVAHPTCLHSGGQPVITGSSTIFVGPDQAPLAGHGDKTQDGFCIQDRNNDNVFMT